MKKKHQITLLLVKTSVAAFIENQNSSHLCRRALYQLLSSPKTPHVSCFLSCNNAYMQGAVIPLPMQSTVKI